MSEKKETFVVKLNPPLSIVLGLRRCLRIFRDSSQPSSRESPSHHSRKSAVQDGIVHLQKQQSIYEQDGPIDYVYFPCSAVISLLTVMENGACVEVAMICHDGFLGLPRYFGMELAFARGIVQIPGESRRMESSLFEEEIERNEF